jgi:hypothetical protein
MNALLKEIRDTSLLWLLALCRWLPDPGMTLYLLPPAAGQNT